MENIIALKCKICGDIIFSKNRHNYKKCSCGECSIDGGQEDYVKISGNPEDYIFGELLVNEEEKKYIFEFYNSISPANEFYSHFKSKISSISPVKGNIEEAFNYNSKDNNKGKKLYIGEKPVITKDYWISLLITKEKWIDDRIEYLFTMIKNRLVIDEEETIKEDIAELLEELESLIEFKQEK